METLLTYNLERSVDEGEIRTIYNSPFYGDIGDYVELDGVGYTVKNFSVENHCRDDLINDAVWY